MDEHQQNQDFQYNQDQNYGYYSGQPNYGQGYSPYLPYGRPPQNSNSFAVVALIMGILSILLACCSGIGGVALGALGIIFAVLSRSDQPMPGQAKGGIGLSIAGMILGGIMLLVIIFMLSSEDFRREFNNELNRYGYGAYGSDGYYDEYEDYYDDYFEDFEGDYLDDFLRGI